MWPEIGLVIGEFYTFLTEVDEATNPIGFLGGYAESGYHGEVSETGYWPFNIGIKIADQHWFGFNYFGMAFIRWGVALLGIWII